MEDQRPDDRVRPNRILVAVSRTGILVNNETPRTTRQDAVWGLPGHKIIFVIENRDTVSHTVRIPIDQFRPKCHPTFKAPAKPGNPLVAGQQDFKVVEPGDRATLDLRLIKDFAFNEEPWDSNKDMSMTYKFNIQTTPQGKDTILLDPDLEVDRP